MNDIHKMRKQFVDSLIEGMRGSQHQPTPAEHGPVDWMLNEVYTGVKPPVKPEQHTQDTNWLKNRNALHYEGKNPFVSEKQVGEKGVADLVAQLELVGIENPSESALEKALELIMASILGK